MVKAYLANQRQGTAAARTAPLSGAAAGSPSGRRARVEPGRGRFGQPRCKGGGVAFPPIPHGWNQKVPKKVKGLARRSAFNARAEEERVVLVDPLKFEAPKTAQLRDYLGSIEAPGKVLFLTEGQKENVYLSARNLPNVEVRPFGEESVYDILWATTVVIERGALENAEVPAGADEEKEAADA